MSLGLPFKIFRFHMLVENCNKVAHLLAKQVTSTNHSERWYVTPACVSDLIMYEAEAGWSKWKASNAKKKKKTPQKAAFIYEKSIFLVFAATNEINYLVYTLKSKTSFYFMRC
jgi:hypothetical protein